MQHEMAFPLLFLSLSGTIALTLQIVR